MNKTNENAINEACEVLQDLALFLIKVHERNECDSSTDLLDFSTKLVELANERGVIKTHLVPNIASKRGTLH